MVSIFGLAPQEMFYLSFSFLVFVVTILAIVITVATIYIAKYLSKLGRDIENSIYDVKSKARKTLKIFDTFIDLFGGDDSDSDDDEEVYVLKKKKK